MKDPADLKIALERTTRALTLKPSLGRSTGVSTTRVTNGLTCSIEEGDWKLVTDMPASVGGAAKGPTPGVLGRAALGSCIAMGYIMKAALKNIRINLLEVVIEADYDDGAMFGVSDADPGYSQVRYIVTIESNASKEDILAMMDEADKHSPYLDVFRRAQDCVREVRIVHHK